MRSDNVDHLEEAKHRIQFVMSHSEEDAYAKVAKDMVWQSIAHAAIEIAQQLRAMNEREERRDTPLPEPYYG
jgi:hypothetical protein